MDPMRILYIRPVADSSHAMDISEVLQEAARSDTTVDVVSLSKDRPRHLEYHAYEAIAVADIVKHVRAAANKYDGIVLGGFYDMGLLAAREISGDTIVTAPCESATAMARSLGQRFSILVGRAKWIPRMTDTVHHYGHARALCSMRAIDMTVTAIRNDSDKTLEKLTEQGHLAVEDDGAEVIILGCTAKHGLYKTLENRIGVPVIDSMVAALKYAEFLAECKTRFGWRPSRVGGSEPPPEQEIQTWGLFRP